MSQHITAWLSAYHDGELTSAQQWQVEQHLQSCPRCSDELETLRNLSALLKSAPMPEQTSHTHFAAQIALQLPRSRTWSPRKNPEQLPRWVLGAPLALLFAWAFFQAALWITSWLLTINWAFGLKTTFFLFLENPDGWLQTLADLQLLNLGLLAGTAVLWSAWLAFWWAWRHSQNLETPSNQF